MKSRYQILAGGLGNQLFQFGYLLSRSSRNKVFIDYKVLNCSKNEKNFPELFDFEIPGNFQKVNKKESFFLTKLASYLIRSSVNVSKTKSKKIINFLVRTTFNFGYSFRIKQFASTQVAKDVGYFVDERISPCVSLGYFQSYKWINEVPEVHEIMKKISLFDAFSEYAIYQKMALRNSPLCVHVRLGDYLLEEDIGILPLDYYRKGLAFLFNKRKFTQIWLFSNEPDSALNFIPTEYRKIVEIIDLKFTSAQTLEIMRLCSGYLIANSTFSWWGAFISKTSNPLVVAPEKWFKNLPDPNQIIPTEWHRIKSFEN